MTGTLLPILQEFNKLVSRVREHIVVETGPPESKPKAKAKGKGKSKAKAAAAATTL